LVFAVLNGSQCLQVTIRQSPKNSSSCTAPSDQAAQSAN
jgi:hypothetical protein